MGSNVKKKINQYDEDDLTPLHYASRYNFLGVVKLLVDNGAGGSHDQPAGNVRSIIVIITNHSLMMIIKLKEAASMGSRICP